MLILLVTDTFLRGVLSVSFSTIGLNFLRSIGLLMLSLVFLRVNLYGFLFTTILIIAIFSLRFAYPKLISFFNLGIEGSYFLSAFSWRAESRVFGLSYWLAHG